MTRAVGEDGASTKNQRLAAILDDRAAAGLVRDDRPDLYAGFGGAGEGVAVGHPASAGVDGPGNTFSNWNWLSFGVGLLCGLVAGILAIAIPATILVEFVL